MLVGGDPRESLNIVNNINCVGIFLSIVMMLLVIMLFVLDYQRYPSYSH